MKRSTIYKLVASLSLLSLLVPLPALAKDGTELDLSFQLGGAWRESDRTDLVDTAIGGMLGAKLHYSTPSKHGFTTALRWYGNQEPRSFVFGPSVKGNLPMLGLDGAYAYQIATASKAKGKTSWFEVLPQAGLTLGYVFARDFAPTNPAQDSDGMSLGPHLGLDLNVHIKNFFVGVGGTYGAMFHTSGPITVAQRPTVYLSIGGTIMD